MVSPEIYQTPIEKLELSPRTLNCLKRAHIVRVGEILEMSDSELLKIRNFGEKSLEELRQKLVSHGIARERKEPLETKPAKTSRPSKDAIQVSAAELEDLMGATLVGEATGASPEEPSDDTPEPPEEEEESD